MNFLPITLVLFCFLCTAFSQFDFSPKVENHVEDHDLGLDLLFPAGSAFESGHRNLQASNTKYLKVSRYQFGGCQKKFQQQTLQYYPLDTCLNPKQLYKEGTDAAPNLPSNVGTWKQKGEMAILGNANPNSASPGATVTTISTQNQIMGLKYTVNKDNVVEVFAYSDTACNNNVLMNNFPLNNEWTTMGTTMSTGVQYSPVNNVAVTDPNPAISTKPSGGSIQSFYATYNAAPGACNDAGKYWPSGPDNKLSGQTQFYQPGSTEALNQAKQAISGFSTLFTNQKGMYYIPFSTKFEVLTNFKPTVLNPNAENIPAMQATSSSTTCTPPTGSSNPPMVVTLKSQTYGACTGPLEVGGSGDAKTLFPLSDGYYNNKGPSYSTVSSLFPSKYYSKKLDCVGGQEVTTYYKDYQCMYPLQRKVMNKCTWRLAGNYGTWNQKIGNSISGGEQNSNVAITNTLTGGWITHNTKVDAKAQPIPFDKAPIPFKQTVFNSGATGNPGNNPFSSFNEFSAAVVRTCTPGTKPETNLLAAPASQWAYAELYSGPNCEGQLFAKDSGVAFTQPSDQSPGRGILLGGACNQCVASKSDFLPAMSTKLKCTPANDKAVFVRSFYSDMECKTEVIPVAPTVPTGTSNAGGVIGGLYSQRSRNSSCIRAPSSQYLYPVTSQTNDYEYFQVQSYRWVIGGPPTGLGYTLSKYPPNGGTTCAGAPWQMATFSLTRADFKDTSTEILNSKNNLKFFCGGSGSWDCSSISTTNHGLSQQTGTAPAGKPPGPFMKKFYGNIISASYKRTGSCDAGNINMQFAADPKSPKNDRFYSDILNTVPTGCQVMSTQSTQSTLYSCDAAPAAKKKSLLSPGEIAAVVILGFLGVMCCIAIGVWFFVYYKPKAGGAQRATAAGVAPPAPAASKNPIGNNL